MSAPPAPATPADARRSRRPPTWLIWLALGIVYVIWGTTYLGIRITNETLPPLLAAGTRFVIAGAVLFAVSTRRRDAEADRSAGPQWLAALLVGTGLIAFGNGVGRARGADGPVGHRRADLRARAPVDRALGSVRRAPPAAGTGRDRASCSGFAGRRAPGERRAPRRRADLRAAARGRGVDELGRRLALRPRRAAAAPSARRQRDGDDGRRRRSSLAWGIARGELALVDPERFSAASVLALGYLVVFGSWIAFTSYVWLLRNARTSLVATYAWVTPMLAVYLGHLIADETAPEPLPDRGRRWSSPPWRSRSRPEASRRDDRGLRRRRGAADGGRGRGPALARAPRGTAPARRGRAR